ncbi:SusC/RagA family TonB-linked outer membrane protein [Pareuzebyella sediminis]|uniref:SusC/RagA family TonB-linked outer membrane protein n=1 Tax=Pareuzebyella sediminis TaxID=2607998 RepID=UPI0011EE1CBF|nr:SusC/RagA family TonB-linked outer membrane protein [Pareuzebyella sediminis]
MKIRLLKNLFVFGIFLCFGLIQAQEVSGTVSDVNGPLPGASVVVKGTTNGTQTDFDGNYTISDVGEDAVLLFSYIGYKGQEIPVAGQTTIDITLAEDAQALEEVVVVGYGSQQKKEITTAVTSVSSEDFNQGTVNDPTQLLQGKVAGLTIVNKGGDPNTNGTVRLRGISTIGGNQEPLVVIDGVLGGSLNNVDPNDIENITVLKDGSAAAIYGTRGSAGVILVTTKSGKTGQPLRLTYNGQFATSSIANQIDVMDGPQFLEAGGNDLGSNTDWIDEVTQTGYSHVQNIAAVGGTQDVAYRVSGNFRKLDGILYNSGFKQVNARTNITARLFDDRLKIDFNSALTRRDSKLGFNESLRYAVTYNPTAPVFGADAPFPFSSSQYGGFFETLGLFDSFNPASIARQSDNDRTTNTLNFSMNFNYRLTDNLSANLNMATQNIKRNRSQYFPTTALYLGNAVSPTTRGLANFLTEEERFDLFEGYLTYTGSISDHTTYTVTGGYSFQESDYNGVFFSLGDFPPGINFDFRNNIESSQDLSEAGRIQANSDRRDGDRIVAFFGRFNATIDNAIYLNASLRREGSSRFGTDNQWGLFPAVAVGADLNKYLELENVNLLKARLGYGVTGAIPPEVGLFATTYAVNPGTSGSDGSSTGQGVRAPNPDLKWEEKAELNLGFEFATDRLSATLDLYTRNIDDFISLVNVDAALFGGISQRYENAGKLRTNGVEFTINYDAIKNERLTYNTGLVFSTYKTTLEENPQGDQVIANLGSPGQNNTSVILVREGEEVGQIWGPVFTGNVNEQGTPILEDVNGDGQVITDQGQALEDNADFAVLGKGIPDFEIGWTNQFTFGNWDANFFFRGAFGHSLVNTFRAFYEPIIGSQSSYNFINTKYARSDIKTAQFSSYYVEKADFVRLDNLSVGYNWNINGDYVKDIRISLAAQNLFTITGYSGTDPEPVLADFGDNNSANGEIVITDTGSINTGTANPLAPGIDRRNSYFTSRTFTLGLNINF